MASEHGRPIPALIDSLFENPRRFSFFQAIRLLERRADLLRDQSRRKKNCALGHDADPTDEAIRIRVNQTFAFPGAEIEKIELQGKSDQLDGPVPLEINFMGLTGPQGVLPQHYTDLVLRQVRDGDSALRDFFDLFNHRLISLFYRAWEKYQPTILLEHSRARQDPNPDLFTFALFSLVGLGTPGLRNRQAVSDDLFLYYAGQFSQNPKNSIALEMMLEEVLRVETQVLQLFGQWLYLEPAAQTRLLAGEARPTANAQLGLGAVAGERVWDLVSKFRVKVGPIDYAKFQRLMPSGDELRPVCQFVRTYVGPDFDFDLQLVLLGPEVPWCALDNNARLGWNTWIRSEAFEHDVDDVVFCLPEV